MRRLRVIVLACTSRAAYCPVHEQLALRLRQQSGLKRVTVQSLRRWDRTTLVTTRERLQHVVNALPEEDLPVALHLIEKLAGLAPPGPASQIELDSVWRGLEDAHAGRTVGLDELQPEK